MTAGPVLLVWLVLLASVGAELLAATVPWLRGAVPYLGIASAALVALTFMRLGTTRGLSRVFALAGMFWLLVMLGLGSLDSLTRNGPPTPPQTDAAR